MTESPKRTSEEWKADRERRRERQATLYANRRTLGPDDEPLPFVGNEYVCPNCRGVIPTRSLVMLAKPPSFAYLLNDIIRCCFCNFNFSYRANIRTIMGERGKVAGTVISG